MQLLQAVACAGIDARTVLSARLDALIVLKIALQQCCLPGLIDRRAQLRQRALDQHRSAAADHLAHLG